ncbi:OmpL47-type beta-barrel domain-containing protein [Paenibacillus sp. MBLB4367]|uniref:OmpL47-type beta-barrel domain-containing protein n=1 Tax=Paenibacillus sp. MBLB4367 TaxID=3384767 RepID=UPI00390824CF
MIQNKKMISLVLAFLLIFEIFLYSHTNAQKFGGSNDELAWNLTNSVANATYAGDYVTRSGSQLLLNGASFRFSGANLLGLVIMQEGCASEPNPIDNRTGLCYPSDFEVKDQLATAKYMGATVIRAQGLGMSVGCALCWHPAKDVWQNEALERMDFALAQAAEHDLKVIVPLVGRPDQCYYQGCGKFFANWAGISNTQDPAQKFWTDAGTWNLFQEYVDKLLNHVNRYTGIAWKDDPAIFAWETGNELRTWWGDVLTSWTDKLSRHIKLQSGAKQLVYDGTDDLLVNPVTSFPANDPAQRVPVDVTAHLALPYVDIYNIHPYPMKTVELQSAIDQVETAGKVLVVGEYGWNRNGFVNGFCGPCTAASTLSDFLTLIENSPVVAGDTYWSLWGHADNYGYIQHPDGFALRYPGDLVDERSVSINMRADVARLRSHAYTMQGVNEPPLGIPAKPKISLIQRVGNDNVVAWEGAVGAAAYIVQRSTTSSSGPWTMVCNSCATDNETPWTDLNAPSGAWYRVQGVNLNQVSGDWSEAAQQKGITIVDPLNDFSKVYDRSPNTRMDNGVNPLIPDPSRAARNDKDSAYMTWRANQITDIVLTAYYYAPSDRRTVGLSPLLRFWTSIDGIQWTPAGDKVKMIPRPGQGWAAVSYSLLDIESANFVRVGWTAGGAQSWSPLIGEVRINANSDVREPDAPTNVSSVAGNGEADISFEAPQNYGGSPITGYTVTAWDGTTAVGTASGTTSPITIANLTNGTSYTFSVIATNGVGDSDSSAPSNSVTPNNTPPITIDNAPENWMNKDITVTLTASDKDSGVANTYYTLDGGAQQPGTEVTITADGTHTLMYWSVDKAGNVETKHTATVRIDKTAPALKVVLDKNKLWPPNHQLVPIMASVNATDSLSGVNSINSIILTSITSNEPDNGSGDGDQPNDIQGAEFGTFDTGFMLRAERAGNGTGRMYTITYTVTDNAGNMTNASATVWVPHDQSGEK